jgi:hypothetical protein
MRILSYIILIIRMLSIIELMKTIDEERLFQHPK